MTERKRDSWLVRALLAIPPWLLAPLMIAVVASVLIGVGAAWGSFMYGDWKCGMPGVECRRIP